MKVNQLEKVYKVMDSALELSIITAEQYVVYTESLLWVKQYV